MRQGRGLNCSQSDHWTILKDKTVMQKGSERSMMLAGLSGTGHLRLTFSSYVFPEDNDDRTVCKEIRHNSTGCLKMKDQCEKCQEILSVGELAGLQAASCPCDRLGLPGPALGGSDRWEFRF